MATDTIIGTALHTESDVEQKILFPLLSGGNYLAIIEQHIRTKEYLSPTAIDKTAGRMTGYYPDYSIWEKAFPLMIVEAKAPDVGAEVGYREATLYAQHLNQKYRTGVNPCRFVMACNGARILFGYWDAKPVFDELIDDLVIGGQALERLKSLCGQAVLGAHALQCLRQIRSPRATRPFNLAGGQALLNSKRPLNTFAADLSPILRRYFSSTADNRNPDIYEYAYVATAEVTEYDRVLKSLMKDRISSRLNPLSQEIQPTRHSEPKLTGVISEFEVSRPREGQLQLITGRVGAGKSLFIRRYKEILQPEDARAERHWAFIDFNTGPADLRTAQAWLCETFLRSFQEENPTFDMYSAEALEQIFAIELNRQKGIYERLSAISPEKAALRRIDDLAVWKEDAQKLALGLCRYFGGTKRELVAVVMDNVDRRNLNDQLDAFQLALWFMKESRAFVILQLRDETYERFKNQPPLDTFRTGIGFHISPPRFIDVVKRRLDLSLDYLVAQTEDRLVYTLPNGMRISYPNTRVGEFLKTLYIDIFHNRRNISRVLQGLAGADVRKALDMFVAILTSGHLSEDALTSQTQGAGGIAIPEYTVLRILMRTEYRYFSDESGFVKNIFKFEHEWENPNNFVLIEILFFLTTHRHVRGQIGLEGYFSVEHIADRMELKGFVRTDILAACNYLVQNTMIEADHMNVDKVRFEDSVRVNSSGFIHLRILSERLEYLFGVLPVTPIFENDVVRVIANTIEVENRNGAIGGYQMLSCVKHFHRYLEYQARRLHNNFAEFGGEGSGAAYILRQIQSTINHFENPSHPRSLQANLLDT